MIELIEKLEGVIAVGLDFEREDQTILTGVVFDTGCTGVHEGVERAVDDIERKLATL